MAGMNRMLKRRWQVNSIYVMVYSRNGVCAPTIRFHEITKYEQHQMRWKKTTKTSDILDEKQFMRRNQTRSMGAWRDYLVEPGLSCQASQREERQKQQGREGTRALLMFRSKNDLFQFSCWFWKNVASVTLSRYALSAMRCPLEFSST